MRWCLLGVIACVLAGGAHAQEAPPPPEPASLALLEVELYPQPDGSLRVVEVMTVGHPTRLTRGLLRQIPLRPDGQQALEVTLLKVTSGSLSGSGQRYPAIARRLGDVLEIRVGDDSWVGGSTHRRYRFDYLVRGAVRRGADHDRLRWVVSAPAAFGAMSTRTEATIHPPEGVALDALRLHAARSGDPTAEINLLRERGALVVSLSPPLGAGERLELSLRLPLGSFRLESAALRGGRALLRERGALLLLALPLLLFLIWQAQRDWRRLRLATARKLADGAELAPAASPLAYGLLARDQLSDRDLAAAALALALRGELPWLRDTPLGEPASAQAGDTPGEPACEPPTTEGEPAPTEGESLAIADEPEADEAALPQATAALRRALRGGEQASPTLAAAAARAQAARDELDALARDELASARLLQRRVKGVVALAPWLWAAVALLLAPGAERLELAALLLPAAALGWMAAAPQPEGARRIMLGAAGATLTLAAAWVWPQATVGQALLPSFLGCVAFGVVATWRPAADWATLAGLARLGGWLRWADQLIEGPTERVSADGLAHALAIGLESVYLAGAERDSAAGEWPGASELAAWAAAFERPPGAAPAATRDRS